MMLKNLKNTILSLIVCALFIIFYIICSPVSAFSQNSLPEIFSPELSSHPKGIFEILFDFPGIINGTLIDIPQSKEVYKEKTSRRRLADDTTGNKENRIISLRPTDRGDQLEVKLRVAETDQTIQYMVYNLLGKIVLGPFNSQPSSNDFTYYITVSSLPNGVYLCVVVGNNFRLREKFIISR